MDNGRPKVELYQLHLKLSRKGGSSLEMTISKSCTVRLAQLGRGGDSSSLVDGGRQSG